MAKSVGAFWKRSYKKDGEDVTYMSGVIDLGVGGQVSVALFKNDRKEEDKHPDYRLVLSEGKRNGEPEDEGKDERPF